MVGLPPVARTSKRWLPGILEGRIEPGRVFDRVARLVVNRGWLWTTARTTRGTP
jgi:hypothetical protein